LHRARAKIAEALGGVENTSGIDSEVES